ncbi:restriction endonuclease subunit S [Parabacteroides distasonis]|uniref:restriction endonuclease subunit S n=1 Tax=Parabacteroides distasonis TaxID=823 RepID=UPI003D019A93
MTKDKDIKTTVPTLRFREFQNDARWIPNKIDHVCKIGNGRDYKHLSAGNIPVYGSGGYMTSVDKFLYDGESVCIGRKGTIDKPIFLTGKFWTVDTLFYTYAFHKCLPKFLYLIFQQINWYKYNEAGGVPSLLKTTIGNINIFIPNNENEQKKIVDCFSSLDDLINAVADKIETLKEYKKGLMQQLFPAEGKTTPDIRFPEFQNEGKWILLPIKKCNIDILTGYAFKGSEILEDNNGTPLMRGINITEGVVRHNNDIDRFYSREDHTLSKYRLLCNDLVIAMDGSKVGRNFALINKQDEGSLLVQRVARLRADNIDFIMFIYQQIGSDRFKKYIDRINTSSGIPHISLKQIEDFKIWTTRNDKEFRMVTNCLSSVDELISTETAKLDQLKNHKKGLMQQLFPKLQ